jgi:glycosyltransferase involved in cell wall biosynthesis
MNNPATFSEKPTRSRVLHVQNGRMYGGVQRMLVCLATERAQAPGMEPVFALCFAEKLAAELAATGAQVEILGPAQTSRPWQWLRAAWRLSSLLAREHFAAVVCHGSWPLALFGICARLRKIPLVLWMHNDTKIRNKNFVETLAGWMRPDLVVANSAYTAASLPLLFTNPPPHVVLPCPVSMPPRRVAAEDRRATLRAEFQTPGDAVVIALAGRPEPWKGHADLLTALAQISSSAPWVCWIIGGAFTAEQSAFVATLGDRARELGIARRVRFVGQREDVAELLAAADLFCQPNVTPEPFGIVFVEALYAGLPVVTTDHGGGREIVNVNCGRLVAPGDSRALAATLEELVNNADLRRALSRAAAPRGAQISDPARVLPALQSSLTRLSPNQVAPRQPRTIPATSNLNLSAHG